MSFYSCGIKKYIPEGEHLYTGATLDIVTDSIIRNQDQLKDELETMISPEPNKKFLGMYLGLYYYYKNQKENPGFINRWLYKKLKEEPVYLSDVETNAVKDLLLNRLERSEEHTSELQSRENLVCRLLLEKKKKNKNITSTVSTS